MIDMSRYAGVQNPQLYQEILDKERKRQQKARPPDNQKGTSELIRAAKKLREYAAKSVSPPSAYKAERPGSSVKAPEPSGKSAQNDAGASKKKQTFQLPGVKGYEDTFVYDKGTYRMVKMPIYEDEYLKKVKEQSQPKAQEELTEEEIVEQIMRAYQNMQNAPSTNQYTFYHNWLFDPESFLTDRKEDVVVTLDGNLGDAQGNDFLRAVSEGIGKWDEEKGKIRFVYSGEPREEQPKLTEEELAEYRKLLEETGDWRPDLGYNEDGSYKYGEWDLDPANKLLIQRNKEIAAKGERTYQAVKGQVVYWPEQIREIVSSYNQKGTARDCIDYETATNIYYGYADPGTYESLTDDQKAAYDAWAQLTDMRDYVDSYIRYYGEHGMLNNELLSYLNRQMHGIIKYNPDISNYQEYAKSEVTAGALNVIERLARLGVGGFAYLFGKGLEFLGADKAGESWVDAAETALEGSYVQEWREHNVKKYTITPEEQRKIRLAYMVGNMLPNLALAVASGSLSLGMMPSTLMGTAMTIGENTWQALQEGATVDQALTYGLVTGIVDFGIGVITGGLGGKYTKFAKLAKLSKYTTDALAENLTKAMCKNIMGQWILKLGITAFLEQPFNMLAMRSEGWLKRLIYDPDAEGISHKQLQEALLTNFFMRAVIQGMTELPGMIQALESGKTDAATIAYLEQQDAKISERLNQAMENFVEGKTPGTMGQTDLAVAEMDANTKASMGGNADSDFQPADRLAETIRMELDAEAAAGDAANRQNNQADFGLEGFDTQNGKNPASTQDTGEGGFKQAQDTNNGPIVQDGSAETFGQIFGTQTDDGAKAQVSVDGQSEKQTKPTSENGTSDATMGVNNERNELPENDAQLRHIFGDRPGHIVDTPKNRQLVLDIANSKQCYLGMDEYKVHWYALELEDGTQIWVMCKNGRISNAGINKVARKWNERTGLRNEPIYRNEKEKKHD